MAQKPLRRDPDRDATHNGNRPKWRVPERAVPVAPPSARDKWLLAAAIVLQIAWIAGLTSMALFARSR